MESINSFEICLTKTKPNFAKGNAQYLEQQQQTQNSEVSILKKI